MRMAGITGAAVALVLAALVAAQPRPDVPLLVSTAWLAEHLHDPGVVILQTGQGAREEVIPGARPVPHESLMTMQPGHDLAAPEDLVAALERAGVSNGSHVVVYGEPLAAGWLFFALDYLGHDRTSMLDGGIDKWRAEGRSVGPVTSPATRGSFKLVLRARLKATADDVQAQTSSTRRLGCPSSMRSSPHLMSFTTPLIR
jgi:thiosulfate/3-mercaptopyruvate sulfurtransferase